MKGYDLVRITNLNEVGEIKERSMFGGVGYFLDGSMFGIEFEHEFYIKASGVLAMQLKEEGCKQYVFSHKKEHEVTTNYFEISNEYLSDGEKLKQLVYKAIKVSREHRLRERKRRSVPNKIKDMPNMRLSTDKLLNKVNVKSAIDLKQIGALEAYLRIKNHIGEADISELLLLRLEGAVTGKHWSSIPDKRKDELIASIETAGRSR